MSFLFLTSALLNNFSQFDENLDKFLSKTRDQNFDISDLMQSDLSDIKGVYVLAFNLPVDDPLKFKYDPSNPKSSIYEEIARWELEIEHVRGKIKNLKPDKTNLRNQIKNMSEECKKKHEKEHIDCKKEIKNLREKYKKYKSWMEDCKGEKDKLMSKLAKYHAKEK